MADETPRTSGKKTKSVYRAGISNYQESPLGATPRPDLRQHYPSPPPAVELKSVHASFKEYTSNSVNTDKHVPDFTQLRKKTTKHTQVQEWHTDISDLKPEGSTRNGLLILTLIFLAALAAFGAVYSTFPRP